jgi:hypothetical protein
MGCFLRRVRSSALFDFDRYDKVCNVVANTTELQWLQRLVTH